MAIVVRFVEVDKKGWTTERYKSEAKWPQAIAFCSEFYVEKIKVQLGMKVLHRKIRLANNGFEFREVAVPYILFFIFKNG